MTLLNGLRMKATQVCSMHPMIRWMSRAYTYQPYGIVSATSINDDPFSRLPFSNTAPTTVPLHAFIRTTTSASHCRVRESICHLRSTRFQQSNTWEISVPLHIGAPLLCFVLMVEWHCTVREPQHGLYLKNATIKFT